MAQQSLSANIVRSTEIPGPRSRAYLERRRAVVSRAVTEGVPICVAHASGATVTDVDGNTFLDFAGGIGVLNTGHTPRSVVAAIAEQASALIHSCFMVAGYEPYVGLAEDLVAMTPGSFAKKVVLTNSGSEAVENAIKIARAHTKRDAVIAFSHAYHGRTLLAMTLTAKHANYRKGFGPFAPEVYRAPFPYEYRGVTTEAAIAELDRIVEEEIGPERVAAIIIEPVAGEGGYMPAPPEFLRHLRAACDRWGALLVLDEIQTGFGRTGTMFAFEQAEIEFDLLTLAKSLAAGMPLAAIVGRAAIMDAPAPGGMGGTYSGNPVACAAARASLALMRDPVFLKRAEEIGTQVRARFARLQTSYEIVGEARGLGPMAALELVTDRATKAPGTLLADAIWRDAYEHGLILVRAGMHNQVLRFIAPLITTDEQLAEGFEVLEGCLQRASR